MRSVETVTFDYLLSREELSMIKAALDYIHHRQAKHQKAFHVNINVLEKLRKEIREQV